ncbi:hypothetical protein N9A86_04660 [Akkermansiaceae bacterium]|nr:hypothetical protein [Akkermansiaceae bacterium]MDB4537713.1 hypothetical protein [Akkermansiaceae bacterium]
MQRALPLIVFVIVLGMARILGSLTPESLGNLQPLGALFFCGMALFGVRGIILPALAWFLTYPLTSAMQGYGWSAQFLVPLAGFAAMVFLARSFKKAKPGKIFLGSLASAVVFYLLTNTLSWAFDPLYLKSWSGFTQALWSGLPQYSPTWMFFRNALISQALFSGLFLVATASVKANLPQPKLLKQES